MSPFIPHFTSECLNGLNQKEVHWPIVSEAELIEDEINLVVQINGKKRAILKVNRDLSENEIMKQIKLDKETVKLLVNKKIQKTIFVSNRLINIIL